MNRVPRMTCAKCFNVSEPGTMLCRDHRQQYEREQREAEREASRVFCVAPECRNEADDTEYCYLCERAHGEAFHKHRLVDDCEDLDELKSFIKDHLL